MFLAFGYRRLDLLDAKLNELQKKYDVEVLGYAADSGIVSVVVNLSIKTEWDSDEEPPQEFPEDADELVNDSF